MLICTRPTRKVGFYSSRLLNNSTPRDIADKVLICLHEQSLTHFGTTTRK